MNPITSSNPSTQFKPATIQNTSAIEVFSESHLHHILESTSLANTIKATSTNSMDTPTSGITPSILKKMNKDGVRPTQSENKKKVTFSEETKNNESSQEQDPVTLLIQHTLRRAQQANDLILR